MSKSAATARAMLKFMRAHVLKYGLSLATAVDVHVSANSYGHNLILFALYANFQTEGIDAFLCTSLQPERLLAKGIRQNKRWRKENPRCK